MKRSAVLLVALLTAVGLSAQPGVRPVKVFSAFDVDAVTFVYCVPTAPVAFVACNTAGAGADAGDGWVGVRGMSEKEVIIRVDAIMLAAGSLDFTIEGRWLDSAGTRATATLIAPISKTAVAAGQPVRIPENVEEIRVGVRINGADDGGDAVVESITVHVDAF